MVIKNYTVAELAAIEPVEVAPNYFRNPFAESMDKPLGAELARRWSDIHWNNGEEDTGDLPTDPLDALDALLVQDSVGWHRVEGPAGLAIFPHQAADVSSWEEACRLMHDSQRPVEPPEEKPVAYHDYVASLRRGD